MIEEKTGQEAMTVLKSAMNNVKPVLEVKSRRPRVAPYPTAANTITAPTTVPSSAMIGADESATPFRRRAPASWNVRRVRLHRGR